MTQSRTRPNDRGLTVSEWLTGTGRAVVNRSRRPDGMRIGKLIQNIALMRMAVLMLTAIGILSLAVAMEVNGWNSSAAPFEAVKEQLVWLLVATFAGVVSASLDYRLWKRAAPWLGGIGTMLLVLVLCCRPVDGCCCWITLGPVRLQIPEFVKLAMVVCLAAWAAPRLGDIHPHKLDVRYPILGIALVVGLILMEPDKGAAILIVITGLLVLLTAGGNKKVLALTAIGVVSACVTLTWRDPMLWRRFLAWWDPAGNPDQAYQHLAVFHAFHSGGFHGAPLGELVDARLALPEASTNFVIAAVGEYLGVCGTTVVILLFVLLCAAAIRIVVHAPDAFGRLMGSGIIILIGVQALLNVTHVLGISPVRGLSLPFLSYGGSGLLVAFVEVGILESIGQRVLLGPHDAAERSVGSVSFAAGCQEESDGR